MKNNIKSFFKTSKKTVISVICGTAVIVVLIGGTACAAASARTTRNSAIGSEAAKSCAFTDAGVNESEVQSLKVEIDYDNGQYVYEVDFVADGIKYEYDIKAHDGTIVKKTTEVIGTGETAAENQGSAAENTAPAAEGSVTLERAKEIALADAGLTAETVTFGKTALDYDDGVSVYDVEFYTDSAKYEYEIAPDTGVIYKKSREAFITAASGTAVNYSIDEAKKIALNDAGVDASQASFTSAKQDMEDGSMVYDFEFYCGNYKYEYEIGAYDGTVREKSVKLTNKVSSGTTAQTENSASNNTGKKKYNNNSGSGSSGASASSDSYISVDEAKEIAVSKAGLSLSDVTFKKTKLERDDGIMVYEIEFYSGRLEYEITLNASTGAVLEYEVDD